MKREICYWKWDEKYNYSEFKLGDKFSNLHKNELIQDSYDFQKYFVKKGLPDYITFDSKKINMIFFESKFLKIGGKDIWNFKIDEFKKEINEYFEPCNSEYQGDILKVLFRDIFTGYAEIRRQ